METLFEEIKSQIYRLMQCYSLLVSESFIKCANEQLTQQFINQTGLKPGKNLRLVMLSHGFNLPVYGEYLIPSKNSSGNKLCITLWVNHNQNPVTIYWKSKTMAYQPKLHEEVDCNDIEFWFESLDPLLYHQQLYPNVTLPFKLKDLSYELVVQRLNMDMVIEMVLNENEIPNTSFIVDKIDKMMNDYNNKSMQKDREDGVVHNWKKKVEDNKLIYDIDTGSAGAPFLKKLLVYLSKMNCFSKVEVS